MVTMLRCEGEKKHDFRVLKGLIFDIDCRTFIKNSLAVAFI